MCTVLSAESSTLFSEMLLLNVWFSENPQLLTNLLLEPSDWLEVVRFPKLGQSRKFLTFNQMKRVSGYLR